MKKTIILTGPAGSGKTWTALAIAQYFQSLNYTGFPPYDNSHLNVLVLYTKDALTIVDSVKEETKICIIEDSVTSLKQIESLENVRKMFPDCLFVFTTRSQIVSKQIDPNKYHLVICNYKPELEVISDDFSFEHVSERMAV